MKGIVFRLLEEVVTEEHGEEVWDSLLDSAGVEGAFTSVASYPDEQMASLLQAASSALEQTEDDVLRWFGRRAMPRLHERYPEVFEGHESARSFVLTLNEVIHPAVRKLFPGAYVPDFDFDASIPGSVTMAYSSKRRLCSFAEGLLEGAADHFDEEVAIEQTACQKRGDRRCTLKATFRGPRKDSDGP